ncbi:MAG: serine/threonine-protein kinase [Polyangiaceae bacterium]
MSLSGSPTAPAFGGGDAPPAHEIAGRYRLRHLLGQGAHGEVWEAHDSVAGSAVAVKLLHPGVEVPLARILLEVSALRYRLPGVVELLDHGMEGDRAYLVMELVRGGPFPLVPKPCAWSDIARPVAALLETLARVHSLGWIHRDLKPANVLVTKGGQVRLLDFGIAYRTDSTEPSIDAGAAPELLGTAMDRPHNDRLTEDNTIVGTLAYAAPEQIFDGRLSSRTDLYAVGVMIYEALAGRRPHDESSRPALFRSKQSGHARPLDEIAPGTPPEIAATVHRLLAINPADRPRSATEVLSLLSGDSAPDAPFVPWLGPLQPLDDIAAAARASQSLDVVGPPGSGRTRCLRAFAQLGEHEPRVVWIRPGSRAFESLDPVLAGEIEYSKYSSLDAVTSAVEAQLRNALAEGSILLADDVERLDRLSAAVLARCLDAGCIVRAFGEKGPDPGVAAERRVNLVPLQEADLRSLFAGPDLLLHLREDAARVLHRRTGGNPGRVVRELTAWERLGVAHWLRGLLVVQRDAIDRLESGVLAASPAEPAGAADLPEPLAETLAWITLAWPHAHLPLLADVMNEQRFRIEADVDALAEAGLVRRLPDGKIEPLSHLAAPPHWDTRRARSAHAAIARALPAGARGRLQHLMLGTTELEPARLAIATEAAALAERLIDEGRLGQAIATLDSGLRHVRGLGEAAKVETERLLALWVDAAIQDSTPQALERMLHAASRVSPHTPAIQQLEALPRAALKLEEWTGQALALAHAVPPFADPRLERARHRLLLQAARREKDDRIEEHLLDEIAGTLDLSDPEQEALLDTWRGRLRYRQGRFSEAAELHARAAQSTSSVLTGVYSRMSGAMARMEAFDFAEAGHLAASALGGALQHRHAYLETTSRWVQRCVAYRTGAAKKPDQELLASVPYIGLQELEATVYLTEAAIAWRASDRGAGLDLSSRAFRIFQSIGMGPGILLTGGLLLMNGGDASSRTVRTLCDLALDNLPPGIGLQGLGMLALAGRLPADAANDATLDDLAAKVPREFWSLRMDVLSIDEARAAIARPPLT